MVGGDDADNVVYFNDHHSEPEGTWGNSTHHTNGMEMANGGIRPICKNKKTTTKPTSKGRPYITYKCCSNGILP